MLHTWVVLPSCSGLGHETDQPGGGAYHDLSKILSRLVAVVLCLSCSIGPAWGEIGTEEKRTIVAAGFGYQIGAVSTIAVKVYDAESGDILSNEIYELAVKESDGARTEPRAAYFCRWRRTRRDRSLQFRVAGIRRKYWSVPMGGATQSCAAGREGRGKSRLDRAAEASNRHEDACC